MRSTLTGTSWQPRTAPIKRRIPPALRDWIDAPGSLTAGLRRLCAPARFNVRVLHAHWGRATVDEAALLGVPFEQVVWHREVLLRCEDQPLVFARTVIPISTLKGPRQLLTRLGSRPLGSILFAGARITRGATTVAAVAPDAPLLASLTCEARPDRQTWARRSTFRVLHRPLLVTEVFLPAMLDRIES